MDDSCDRILKVKRSCNVAPGVVDLSAVEDEDYIKGGILNDKVSWVSCGPRLTNLNNHNGSKKTGWTFGRGLGDNTVRVVCVEQLTVSSLACPILVVGCENDNGGTLCFYHSGCSRVLKVIKFSHKITSVEVISKANEPNEKIHSYLGPWNGIVAVGTSHGKVYLVDVCWRQLERYIQDFRLPVLDEQRPGKLLKVTFMDLVNDPDQRIGSKHQGKSTVGLWLNDLTFERSSNGPHPGLHNILGRMPLEFLSVSAIKYFPYCTALAVGYNTSCFQLWDLHRLQLLYTSALLEAMLPVHSFSMLEPSDDPRYVLYLWSMHHSVDEDNIPFAGMYIISYNDKYQWDRRGVEYNNQFFYEGFSSCSIRYQLDLGADMTDVDVASGRIISCQSIHRSTAKPSPLWLHADSEEKEGEEGTDSLLTIAWEVWTPNQLSVYRKLTLFDLNQWYREYMPTSSDMEYSQFMTHFSLPDGPLLNVKVVASSVKQYQALQPLDEHFYPTATSFDCLVLQRQQLLLCCHVGVQQAVLESLTEAGPSGLLLPACLYKQCVQAGVRPLLVDVSSPTKMTSSEQRAYLLSVALEHELTQYLRQCAAHWADGSHAVAGCTLPALLGWAWDRVQRYKKWLDRLCVPLFDYSGTALDANDLGIFHHMICQFHRLRDLFSLVLDKYSRYIIKGNFEQQYTVINLVAAFYDSIFWCVRNNVLPEVNANEDKINRFIPYFTDKIISYTITRRAELHQAGKCLQDPAPVGLLLIDAVIAQEAGQRVTDQWEREGGAATLGKYPPSSVQSLLRTYLIRNVPVTVKHFIVTYFLLDVADVVCSLGASESVRDNLLKYPTDFGLTESQSKIVQAFWCLDHKDFQSGVALLLDSCVCKDLQLYQHRTVLSLLAAVGEYKLALHYLTTRRRTPTEPQDVRMEMTLLLANELIYEAFQFQRHHQSMSSELLDQFFKGCAKINKLDVIFKLALTTAEEEAFMGFLNKTCHPQADDLRVLYLLSRSRYIEAIDMNEKLHSAANLRRGMGVSPAPGHKSFGSRGAGGGPPSKALSTRDLIINSVSKSLPSITRDLAEYCHKEKHFSWKQIDRPKPLSVVVHTELSKDRLPYYKTSDTQLIQAAVSKTREIWAPLLATPAALKRKLQTTVEDTPFLRSAIHPRLNSSVSKLEEARFGVRGRADDDDLKVAKRARLEFSPSEKGHTQHTNTEVNSDKTSDMEITCPISSAVLHTPLVAKIVKKPTKEIHTPQSILKGKSGPNTPLTPAREKMDSPVVVRQIRFSLPAEGSPSPGKSEEEVQSDEGEYLRTLSPRKSIHNTSDLTSRLPTPSNPRVLRKSHSFGSVSRLKFEDNRQEVSPSVKFEEDIQESSSSEIFLQEDRPSAKFEEDIQESSSSENFRQEDSPSAKFEEDTQKSSSSENFRQEVSQSAKFEEDIQESSSSENFRQEDSQSAKFEEDIQESSSSENFKITYGLEGNMKIFDENISKQPNIVETVCSNLSKNKVEMDEDTTISRTEYIPVESFSKALQNQEDESMHLTLELSGDTSKSLRRSSRFRKSSSLMNVTLERSSKQECQGMQDFELEVEVMHPVEQEIQLDPIGKDVKETISKTEKESSKHAIDVCVIEEEIVSEAIKEPSLSAVHTNSDELEMEIHATTEKLSETVAEESVTLSKENELSRQYSNISRVSVFEGLDVTKIVEQDKTFVDEKDMHGSESTSQQNIKWDEPEKEAPDSKIKAPTIMDSSLGSVRASTPLPFILEELVKKGRISLSVSDTEKSNITVETSKIDSNKLTSGPGETVFEDEMSKEGLASESQNKIEDLKLSTSAEKDIVPAKNSSPHPTKGALKQMFVFGNQSNTNSAINSNLTYTIGTNVFGSSLGDDTTCKTDLPYSNKSESESTGENEIIEEEVPDEPQVGFTSDEPKTEVSSQIIISQVHSIESEVIEEELCNVICESVQNPETSESKIISSDSPEDGQVEMLDFFVDTGAATTKHLEADSTVDFELKMSEDESIMEVSHCENNDLVTPEVADHQEEPVFQTPIPVEFQDDEGQGENEILDDQLVSKEEEIEDEVFHDQLGLKEGRSEMKVFKELCSIDRVN